MTDNMETKSPEMAYEAPAVEAVLNAEDVEREVHYAGAITLLPA